MNAFTESLAILLVFFLGNAISTNNAAGYNPVFIHDFAIVLLLIVLSDVREGRILKSDVRNPNAPGNICYYTK
jgi:hypothetical protein